ncbi:FixH family protein [Sphaerisporangium sp. NBC_01403]|uniref:FixH family protein n=1 Tax=Sphaerisporangium sp. NBC_01403 TaxID=2903599 RepID=UPI00325056B9
MSRRSLHAVAATIVLAATVAGCAQSRADDTTSPAACLTQKQSAGLTVQFTTSPCPAQGGTATTAQVTIKDSAGALVQDAAVKVNYDMPSMNMHGGEQSATRNGDAYESRLVLGMSGVWVVNVQVSRGSGAPAAVRFDVKAK